MKEVKKETQEKEDKKMKKSLVSTLAVLLVMGLTASVYAADQTVSTTVSADVPNVFSMSFHPVNETILYTTGIPFGTVDPNSQYNLPTGRTDGDGKNDVGIICRSNSGNTWYLKTRITLSGLADKISAYVGQPTDLNTGSPAGGSLGHGDWYVVPCVQDTVYIAGAGDTINTPNGTLATMSFRMNATGTASGSRGGVFEYTLTETL